MPPRGGKRPNAGRPKGVPNKVSGAVKDMILEAVTNKGGVKYFEKQADGALPMLMGVK